MPCTFRHWHALAATNQRLWETSYLPRPRFEPWEGWQAWLAVVQEVYEAQHGRERDDANVEP